MITRKHDGTLDIYLIQRCIINEHNIENNAIIGIDSLFRFDYMGSSEFEFGALHDACKDLVKNYNNYNFFDAGLISDDNRNLKLFCFPEIKDEVIKFLALDASKSHTNLKEQTYLKDSLYPKSNDKLFRRNAWWGHCKFLDCFS